MKNIVNDISILTTIPEKSLAKFFRKMIFCICEAIEEDILTDDVTSDGIIQCDIGIGILSIKYIGEKIKYHFQPNDLFNKALINTINNKKNYLEDLLNDALAKKFEEVYKELC